MPKAIKFNTSALSKTRGKGNMRIGANSYDYGTSYYSMVEPPDGGYTIYENKASGGPSIRVANNEAELINLTRESSGTTYASAAECLAWFAGQTDKVVVSSNDTFDDHVTDGLVLELNAFNLASYPTTGTTWYDLSGNGYNGTLVNGPTFDSNSILFDGVNDYVILSGGGTNNTHAWTADNSVGSNILCYEIWFKGTDSTGRIISKPWNGSGQYNISVYPNSFTLLVGTQSNTISFPTINDGNWHQLIVWANSTQMGYYLDGASSQNSITHNLTQGVPSAGNNNLPLGLMTLYFYGSGWAGNTGHAQNGNVASFKKYNRVITASEAKQNFYKGKCVTNNLEIYYDADNLVSTQDESQWYDISGNGRNATKSGSPTLTTLGGAKCWNFTSTGQFFDYNNSFSNLTACTLEAWIYPASSEVSVGDRGTIIQGNIYMSWNKSNRRLSTYWYSTNNQGYHEPTLQMNREEWYHLITVWTGTQLLQYIDGKLERTVNTTISNGYINRIRIAQESSGRQFAGGIAMVKMYSDALTESEVQTNYNSYRNRFGK